MAVAARLLLVVLRTQAMPAVGVRTVDLVDGDQIDYGTGARTIFDTATHSHRFLLTFKGCGHAIDLGPAPEAMRQRGSDAGPSEV